MAKGQVVPAKKEVATVNSGLIMTTRPDWIPGSGEQARGSENVSTADLIIPRLELVQALSPIKEEDSSAKDGDIYNSVTKQIYGQAINLIPVFYRKEYLIWAIREKGKPQPVDSFKGAHQTPDAAHLVIEGFENPDDYEVIDTPQQFCLLVQEDGTTEEVVVSMSRTKNKVSRKWNSLIRMAGGDRFGKVYSLYSVKEKNAYGTFYNFDVEPVGWPSQALYKKAESIYAAITSGAMEFKVDNKDSPDTSTDNADF